MNHFDVQTNNSTPNIETDSLYANVRDTNGTYQSKYEFIDPNKHSLFESLWVNQLPFCGGDSRTNYIT